MASLEWTNDALNDLAVIDFVIAQRIVAKAKWLEENFEDVVPEKLRKDLRGLYKLRVGDYRAIYSIRGNRLMVEAVGHRREIYR